MRLSNLKHIIIDNDFIVHGNSGCIFDRKELKDLINTIESIIKKLDEENTSDEDINIYNTKIIDDLNKLLYTNNPTKKEVVDDLYLIQNTKTKNLKIGRSKNVKARLKQLNIASEDKLVLLFESKNKGFIESELHNRFNKIRLNSEWFKYNEEIINVFKNEL